MTDECPGVQKLKRISQKIYGDGFFLGIIFSNEIWVKWTRRPVEIANKKKQKIFGQPYVEVFKNNNKKCQSPKRSFLFEKKWTKKIKQKWKNRVQLLRPAY